MKSFIRIDISQWNTWGLERNPVSIYMFKVNNKNTKTRCEIFSKLTVRTLERYHWRRSGVFIVNFEHISHLVLVFPLLTLIKEIRSVERRVRVKKFNSKY